MALETYIPTEVRFEKQVLTGARQVTLYDADGASPYGSITTPAPLAERTAGGPLVVIARRDGGDWELTLPRIRVRGKSAMGFEFDIMGPIHRASIGSAEV